jgi:tetratricopeptide (TPR) repeat protein
MKGQSRRTLCAAGLITAALASGAFAQQQEEKLGTLSFPTSCDPKVQAEFERGVAMIHSYWFVVARRVFEGVLQQDPGCAIAYWGIAMDLLGNSLGGPPSRENANAAWVALEKAREIGAKTDRERGWIDAIRAYYRDHDKTDVETRLRAYNSAMEQMAQRYPDDYEVQVFYALTLQASASKTDMSYGNQLKSVAILEKLFEQNPQHPGVSHFIIHAYDFPPLAERGIAAAKRYGGIAPAVPHARHMPSHIYSMVGMWEESIASNTSAMEIQPDYYHAADFTVYAHLQLAQDVKAKALIDKAIATQPRGDGADGDALSARSRRLARRCGDADEHHHGADSGFALSVHPRPRHGALGQPRRRQGGDRGDEGLAHGAATRRSVLLGRSHRGADAGYFRLDRGEGRRARPSGAVHACGRGWRGRQHQERDHGEPPLSDARDAGRTAAGSRPARAGAEGI